MKIKFTLQIKEKSQELPDSFLEAIQVIEGNPDVIPGNGVTVFSNQMIVPVGYPRGRGWYEFMAQVQSLYIVSHNLMKV